MGKQKSWLQKLNDAKDLPRIVTFTEESAQKSGFRMKVNAGDTMVIPSPIEVNMIMRKVPKRKLITINEIRKFLAQKYQTTTACPITSGIFAWIAANAAEEESKSGKKRITPYWRTLKSNGEINEKYPGGVKKQIKLLEEEGFEIIRKGKKFFVQDFEKYLLKEIKI